MLRVLIVDDDEDVAAVVQERLDENFGDDCRCQSELLFDRAVGQIRSLRPDVGSWTSGTVYPKNRVLPGWKCWLRFGTSCSAQW